jgi:hypothetical protein
MLKSKESPAPAVNEQVTIEQLAEYLGKTVWTKGDLKRIYMNDSGWNTKKMSTKTFIFQAENGDFKVSCKVECPSQPWQWCKSQEDEVKESMYKKIDNALEIMNLTLVDYKVLEETPEVMVYVRQGSQEPSWFTEDIFYEKFGKYPEDIFPELPTITVASAKEEEPLPIFQTMESNYDMPVEVSAIKMKGKRKHKSAYIVETYGIGTKVRHIRFGDGEVIFENDEKIEIKFSEGVKNLAKKFAKLEKL